MNAKDKAMRHLKTILTILTCALCAVPILPAQEMPEMPQPAPEHEWLQRFVGHWESSIEFYMDPEQPPAEVRATERFRSIGGFWIVSDIDGQMEGMPPFSGIYTVGYDPEEEKYIGTWIDSTTSSLRMYEGTLDAEKSTLMMETEGPCPMRPGETVKFKEVTEFRQDDHRVVTSFLLIDGEWTLTAKVDSQKIE